MGRRGVINVGQLVRQRVRRRSFFSRVYYLYRHGNSRDRLGRNIRAKAVRPALEKSYENVFHNTGLDRFLLLMPKGSRVWRER